MSKTGEQLNTRRVGNELRYSAQRELIYEMLLSTKSHPTAEAVYEAVKERLPDIGIATVYRNLKQLVESGKVTALETTNGRMHYDADTTRHAHFICEACGEISDVNVIGNFDKALAAQGYTVTREKLVLYGICPKCNMN